MLYAEIFKGPLAFPIVGNIFTKESLVFMRYLASCRKKFGTVFVYFALTKPYLVITEPNAARRILSDSKTFVKGDDYTSKFNVVFGQGLVTSTGEKHKNDRACFGKYFVRVNLAKQMDRINAVAQAALESFVKPGQSQNVEDLFAVMTLRVFMNFCVGTDFSINPDLEKRFCRAVSTASFNAGMSIVFNLPIVSFNPFVAKLRKFCKFVWDDLFKPIADQRRVLIESGTPTPDDPLDLMLRGNMTEKDIADHIITLICAGHDTTSFLCSYMLYLMGQNPVCQQNLREEIFKVLGTREIVTADDLLELKYLHMSMQETCRLFAVIPIITRTATEEVYIKESGLTIPEGTDVMVPMFLLNRDADLWERQAEFDPTRFEGKIDFTWAKNGYFPFGYGSRTCIGNTMAQMEVATFMCHILRKYSIEPDPKYKMKIQSGISLTTSNGVNVIFREL